MKKIAIPVASDLLCPHFGHCEKFAIYEISDHAIQNEEFIDPPPHEPGVLPSFLAEKGVTDVIAGGMGQRAIGLFNKYQINVYVGVGQQPPRQTVEEYLKGELRADANLCDH